MSDSLAKRIAKLPPAERKAWLDSLPDDVVRELANKPWWYIGRPEQFTPPGTWRIWLLRTGRDFGKALDMQTPVPTPTGWTTMGQLQVGDEVFSADGSVTRVAFVTGAQYGRQCFEVTFHDHTTIVADAEHQWTARARKDRRNGNDRPFRTVTTAEMYERVRIVGNRESNWQMPAAGPLQLPDADLLVDPYVLGLWLGDGSSKSAELTMGAKDIAELSMLLRVSGDGPTGKPRRRDGVTTVTIGGTGHGQPGSLSARLRALGLLSNKHIPMHYLRASQSQREELLAGLIDSDGHVNHRNGGIELTTVKKALAEQYVELVRSLGHRATMSTERAMLKGRDVGPKHRITWVAREGGGKLARKRLVDRHHLGQSMRLTTRYVKEINPVETRPVCCIAVDHPSGLYLAGKEMLVTHNTRAGAENFCDWIIERPFDRDGEHTEWGLFAAKFSDCKKVMVQGPSGLLRALKSRGMFEGKGYVYNRSDWVIRLTTGQVIHMFGAAGADPEDIGRGYNFSGVWLDEFAKWPKPAETWMEGINLALRIEGANGEEPRAIVTTTPKRIQILRDWAKREGRDIFVTRGSIDDNRDNIPKAVLAEYHDLLDGTTLGRQELYGEQLEDVEGALWRYDDILVKDLHVQMARIIIAVDPAVTVSETSDETGIIVCGKDVDGGLWILDDLSGKYSAFDWASKVNEYFVDHVCSLVVVEKAPAGDVHAEVLHSVNAYLPVKAINARQGKMARAEPIAMLYAQHKVVHVKHFDKLEDQLMSWDPENSTKSPDRLDALVHGLTELAGITSGSRFLSEITATCEGCGKVNDKNVARCIYCQHVMNDEVPLQVFGGMRA